MNAFIDALNAVSPQSVGKMKKAVERAFNARVAFETVGGESMTANMSRKIEHAQRSMQTDSIARLLCACDVDPEYINREIHKGSRYNIYALEKDVDVMIALVNGVRFNNKYNDVTAQSLIRFNAANKVMNNRDAQAQFCPDIASDNKGMLVKFDRFVAPSTADTQASSTLNSFMILGIVDAINPHTKTTLYKMTGNHTAQRVKEIYGVAQ